MNFREKLIDYQNKAELAFNNQKSFSSVLNYILAIIIFFSSTLYASLSFPFRYIWQFFQPKNQSKFIQIVNSDNSTQVLSQNGLILLDFWAEWCGPCILMNPIIEDFTQQHQNITIAKINVENNRVLANKFNIRGIPQFILMENGKEIRRHAGPMTQANLKKFCMP